MSTHKKKSPTRKKATPPQLVWFEIPADQPERARQFYGKLFDWNINPIPSLTDYWHIETGGPEGATDGGLMRRKCADQRITQYIGVASVTRFLAKVVKLGGKVCQPKTAIVGMGYAALCKDTENNLFALWERNPNAK